MNKLMRFLPVLLGSLIGMVPASIVNATTFGTYDPRSLAMGGTGVSQANIDHAAYYNPALLSVAQEDDDFSTLLTLGLRIYDPNDLWDAYEAHTDGNYETALDQSMDALDASGGTDTALAKQAAADAQRLLDSFVTLSDKPMDIEAQLGLGVSIPGKGMGFAVTGTARGMAGVLVNVTDADRTLIQRYIDELNYVATNGSANDTGVYVGGNPVNGLIDISNQLDSYALVRGAVLIEGGVSLSHEFESLNNWSIGITPKNVQVTTYDYKVSVQDSEFDEDKGKREYEDTNIDIGIAKRISESWKFGLVVKNAVKKEYQTERGNTIVLEPSARMGISHHTNWTTIALDVDLTENDRIGLTGEKTQYAALGMEFDLSLLQLRVGARHNMAIEDPERDPNMLTAGLGIYFLGLHVDLAYAESEDEKAAALQAGFQF